MSEYRPDDELLQAVRAARPAIADDVVSPHGSDGRAAFQRVLASPQKQSGRKRGRKRSRAPGATSSCLPLRRAVAGVPVLLSILLTVLIAAIALTAIKHGRGQGAVPASPSADSRQQLIKIVGVLRRPQTKTDRNPTVLSRVAGGLAGSPGSVIDLPLVRYATTTAWGQKLYLVPITATSAKLAFPRHLVGEQLVLATPQHFASATGYNATGLKAGLIGWSERAGHAVLGGGSSAVRFVYVVPDGVARVAFVLPRDPLPGVPFEAVYSRPLSVTVPVHDNIAAVQINRQFDRGDPPMIWYAANGSVVKRIGNFRDLDRAVPEPQPGPETPLSLAAESDPSTPNPVWITPAAGGPDTHFTFHFRVLLNEANYTTQLSGPSCPGEHLYGLNGELGSQPEQDNLRGRIHNAIFANPDTTWCAGTYHLSVTLITEAFDQPFKPPAKPFGTASFTVNPGPTAHPGSHDEEHPQGGNSTVINDCLSHGRLTQTYSTNQLSHALAVMSASTKQYTDCFNVIQQALR